MTNENPAPTPDAAPSVREWTREDAKAIAIELGFMSLGRRAQILNALCKLHPHGVAASPAVPSPATSQGVREITEAGAKVGGEAVAVVCRESPPFDSRVDVKLIDPTLLHGTPLYTHASTTLADVMRIVGEVRDSYTVGRAGFFIASEMHDEIERRISALAKEAKP